MTDDPAARALISRIDLSGLLGPAQRPDPVWSTVRKVSESGGFIDRSPRATRRHLTGGNHQFNAKATAETIRRFNAICDGQRWVAGTRARTSRRVGGGGSAARNDRGGDQRA